MQFEQFSHLVKERFAEIAKTGKLFQSSVTGHKLWHTYLNGFEKGKDSPFRDPASTEHTCNNCNNFIRRYGNIVAIDSGNKIITMFDLELPEDSEYFSPAKAMSDILKGAPIQEVFFETFEELNLLPYEKTNKKQNVYRLGVEFNHKMYTPEEAKLYGVVKAGQTYKFHHFHVDLPKEFVDQTGSSQAAIQGEYRDAKNVFKRGLDEIPVDTLELVKDLINQGSLLDGTTHIGKIDAIIPLKKKYDKLPEDQKDNWTWVNSFKFQYAKFRNELIGVLCSDLAQGVELNKACQDWNKRVDPANYMKATAPITKKQIEEAKKFVEENGYEESFDRRFAIIDDISVEEIMHSNTGNGVLKTASIFDTVKSSTPTRHKKSQFDGIEEVPIEKFMKDILPSCTGIEAFLENRMDKNFVVMTTANNPDSKKIFKWDNNFSWTFNGNLAGKSQIKEAVKSAGGITDGVLNFRLAWAYDGNGDESDMDAWAKDPSGVIGFSTDYRKDRYLAKRTVCSGQLDVDNRHPGGRLAVENITWNNKSKMKDGVYKFWVNQFSANNSKGFRVEIEIEGDVYTYEYDRPVTSKANIHVAEVTLKNGVFSINHLLPESNASKEVWGLETNQFHKVDLVCLSPNHWGKNNIGNKHYMFMLHGCKSNTDIRSFHNENLNNDLLRHRKVTEVLGATAMLKPTKKQLAGIGFNSTVKDELILKLSGSFKRTIKVKF